MFAEYERIPLAYTDPPGWWRIRSHDVMTGRAS